MKRRSFCLGKEDLRNLQNVCDLQEHTTVSQTIRFCIDFTYTAIASGQSGDDHDQVIALLKKNNIILRALVVELTKLHGGKAEPLNEVGRKYLANLKKQLEGMNERS